MKGKSFMMIFTRGMGYIVAIYLLLLTGCVANVNSRGTATLLPVNEESKSESPTVALPTKIVTVSVTLETSTSSSLQKVTSFGKVFVKSGQGQVYIRNGPGNSYERMGVLLEGKEAGVISKTVEGDWLQISLEDGSGWVYAELVNVEGDQSEIPCNARFSNCELSPTPDNYESAVKNIRTIIGDSQILLHYMSTEKNPNANLREVYVFRDDDGGEYQVDTKTNQVIQFIRRNVSVNSESSKSFDEIKQLAEAFATKNSLYFVKYSNELVYSTATKDGPIFSFRWDLRPSTQIMPPFLQVILNSNGQIVSYINALDIVGK